jgi:hypothetical protein
VRRREGRVGITAAVERAYARKSMGEQWNNKVRKVMEESI